MGSGHRTRADIRRPSRGWDDDPQTQQPQRHSRLRSCQANTLVLQHNICHLFYQLADVVVDVLDWLGGLGQNLSRIMRYPASFNINHFHLFRFLGAVPSFHPLQSLVSIDYRLFNVCGFYLISIEIVYVILIQVKLTFAYISSVLTL